MGFVKKIVNGVTNVVSKVVNVIKAPLDMLLKPVKDLVSSIADKLPFGLGKVIKPFVDTFLDSAVGWMAGGPLGGFLATLGKVQAGSDLLKGAVNSVDSAIKNKGGLGLAQLPEQALSNARQGIAYTHAQSLT